MGNTAKKSKVLIKSKSTADNPSNVLTGKASLKLSATSSGPVCKSIGLVFINSWNKKTVVFATHSVIEPVYLADRVFVMTSRPVTYKGIVNVDPLPPRNYNNEEFLKIS